MEADSDKAFEAMELGRDPSKKLIGFGGDEPALLVPLVCLRRLAMCDINWVSMDFLGT
jgi:hypothetical protein